MKPKLVAPLLTACLLSMSVGTAIAQQRDEDHGGGPSHNSHMSPHGNGHRPPPHEASLGGPGGPVPHNDWHKGDRLPAEYRDHNYRVDNWHEHGLEPPPRGYQWVGVNGDYVLAAIATGVIASVLTAGH